MTAWELGVLNWIQSVLRTPLGDELMVNISQLANGSFVWFIMAAVLLCRPETRRQSASVLLALLFSYICCDWTLKPLVARLRPCDLNPAVSLLIARPTDYSFPSGHTAASFAAASAMCFSGSSYGPFAIFFAVLVGLSRMYLYVHFPSDVLAGALLGTALGWAGSKAAAAIWKKRSNTPKA